MNPIRIAIADDHVLFRKGMVSLLETESNIRIMLEAGSGRELIAQVKNIAVDIVLMDVAMPDMDGLEATRLLRELMPDLRIVMLSAHNEKDMILHAIENGARGYLLKDSEPEELIDAVNTVMQNGFCFNKDISHLLLKGIVEKEKFKSSFNPQPQFSERELEVLQLICKEMTNTEIGEKIFLSSRTVEGHRQRIIEKIGARNTVGIVLYALKNKLVEIS
jgi:DNA-binding NarL/FixJ family response regulator